MVYVVIYILVGYIGGVAVGWFLFEPTKCYDEAYEAAKKLYSNWEKGWDAGWDAGVKAALDAVEQYYCDHKG